MIRLENIHFQTGDFAFSDLNLCVPTGAYGILMGKTGGGKTTLLELVCGLRQPHSGRIWIGDKDVTFLPPGNRGLGYVPQDGALFPTLTVREQLGFALSIRKRPASEIEARVTELATAIGITSLLNRLPEGLSGGEKQRVALGRALAANPAVLLLDEPLSALDEETRAELMPLLKRIQRKAGVTVLHVTHHRLEAEHLADAIFHLENNRIAEAPNHG
jgi:ABC-type sugar transport system ATPase subunit